MLREAAKLARTMYSAVQELEQSVTFLRTSAQKDLLREMVAILTAFFPAAYGVIDKDGKVIKSSTRSRTEINSTHPLRSVPFYFHHDTWLFLSYQKFDAAGSQRPFTPGYRNWIYLYVTNLSSDTTSLARVLIHEMTHMLSHRYRSVEEKFGARVAGGIPTKAAGALLNRSTFDPLRRTMEQHFLRLVDFLNRQPHRAGKGSFALLPSAVTTNWGTHVVEEVLAFVITERATWALAQFHAQRSGGGVSQELILGHFLKDYFRRYWLSDSRDRAALKRKDADQVFGTMEADLVKLVKAVKKHIGP